jgi:hypothetical protein
MVAVGNIKIPSFGGENFSTWLKEFKMAMLMLDFDENDTKQAKFFSVCLVEGSVASQWYETLDDQVKSSWTALQPNLKNKFGESVDDKHSAFREMVGLRLADRDVGVPDEDGVAKHVAWARKIAILSRKAGEDPNDNNAYLVFNNVGEALQNVLTNTGNADNVSRITAKVETLSPIEVESIGNIVRREEQAAALNTRLQQLERQLSGTRLPLSTQSTGGSQQNQSYEKRAQSYGRQDEATFDTENINLGPFPATASGIADYKKAVNGWYSKYGTGATSSLSRPFPLSPGTADAGSNECFNCGQTTHLRVNCSAKHPLPLNEQRYRGMIMQQRRNRPAQNPATGTNTQAPIRSMGWNTIDDRFYHLIETPPTPDISPEMKFGHLPEFFQGNELGLDL